MLRPPNLTIRLRLTALYGGMVLLAGGLLIAIFYLLYRGNFPGSDSVDRFIGKHTPSGKVTLPSGYQITYADLDQLRHDLDARRDAALARLLRQCIGALAGVAGLSVALGWWMAGRALRPVHEITATARRVAGSNLRERIALRGPRDELKELADTFDAMLERLDASFDSQRRFVANASHELRTPLATNRTMLEVALAQHEPGPELRHVLATVLETNQRNEALIDGLLALARSENGTVSRQRVDLSDIAAEAVEQTAHEAGQAGVCVDATPDTAMTLGDPGLLERLALNLLRNGIQHNVRGGIVTVRTGQGERPGYVELVVTNSGPQVAAEDVAGIFEPFRRLRDTRADHDRGVGLGLSIVRTVVATHHGTVTATPRPEGGLIMTVQLPSG